MNKKFIAIAAVLVTFCLGSISCTQYQTVPGYTGITPQNAAVSEVVQNSPIETAVAVATNFSLKFLVKPESQTKVANYINVYATALRTITGSPTPEQLMGELHTWIPENIKSSSPILITIVTNLIANNYQKYYGMLSGNPKKIAQYLNHIASGLEFGSRSYISPPTPTPVKTS